MKNKKINTLVIFSISIIYLELLMKYVVLGKVLDMGLIYLTIFILPVILLLTFISKLFSDKVNMVITFLLMLIITLYFEVQYVFYTLMDTLFSFSTIGLADQALDFMDIVKDTISSHLPIFLLILVPFILLIILNIIHCVDYDKYKKESKIALLIMFTLAYGVTFVYLLPNKNNTNSVYKLYFNTDDANSMIDNFGFINYVKVDVKRVLFGYKNEVVLEKNIVNKKNKKKKEKKEIVYKDNIMNVNFEEKASTNREIQSLNDYFSNSTPSVQNEYTGMFKGKNLIFILAEGYNEVAMDKDRTPTLYKMYNEGFNFTNFYSPVFLSTTGGEFQSTTGLIPTQETLLLWKNKKPDILFGLGHAFGNIGYRAQSYHNWTYTYYKRHITMGTLGFSNYTGCNNGLEKRMDCGWLPSDIEMMDVTTPDYLGKDGNFVTFYVTVSGHSPYNTSDNIAKKYLDNIDPNLSSQGRYYLAAQMELDKALEELIKKLEESGELDNTVIAMVGDHYPYTLSIDEMNELASYKKDEIVEVNKSNFFLWSSSMKKPITIEKTGSQIDVLPTLLNLFGVEYDSRMIVGKDILSDYPGIAIFSNRSWVSDYGTYFSNTRTFNLKDGKVLDNQDEYINSMNQRVANGFSISKMLMNNRYYNYIFDK